jgi:hypothetical protein
MKIDDNSIRNWMLIPSEKREAMLAGLRAWLPASYVEDLGEQGLPVRFHFNEGMQIRNRLRDHLKDDELPPTRHGQSYNWDDYYLGAVAELIDGQK